MKLFEALDRYDKVRHNNWKNGRYLTRNKWGNVVNERGEDWLVNFNIVDDNDWVAYREILTDSEKKYLSALIKPFRDRVVYICKVEGDECSHFISIKAKKYDYDEENSNEYIDLPYFREDTMYVNMEVGKEYNLEELGL